MRLSKYDDLPVHHYGGLPVGDGPNDPAVILAGLLAEHFGGKH